MNNYPQVRVVWLDAESTDDWTPISDVDSKVKHIVMLGHLIKDNEDGLVLAMNYDPDNKSVSMTMALPNHWIESVEYL
jgi:hypothetical protein